MGSPHHTTENLGIRAWLTQDPGEACFLRPSPHPSCFTCHAGHSGKCHPPQGAARPLLGGGLPFRK